jgi:hypothetical protein
MAKATGYAHRKVEKTLGEASFAVKSNSIDFWPTVMV